MVDRKYIEVNSERIKEINNKHLINQKCVDIFTMADALFDAFYITDTKGIVISANNWYSDITGIASEEIIGKSMQNILDEKYLKGEYFIIFLEYTSLETKKYLYNINELKTNKPWAISDMVLQQKKEVYVIATIGINGRSKKVLFVGIPILDNMGKINYVLTVIREMTEMVNLGKKLEEIEKKNKQQYNVNTISLRNNYSDSDLIGEDPTMIKIRQLINYVSKTDVTVLITGETGTGKEVVAREIYKNSSRNTKSYITVNCAAIPETLLESELFGYEKGAFTGAQNKTKLGYFEQAHGGTILLDEIGEMPIHIQSKLLRVLQEKEIKRLGGTKPIHIDIRILASTNQDLDEKIREGAFREDLYYRLNVIPIKIPPLRERIGDIALLSHLFLENANIKYLKNKKLKDNAIDIFEKYNWPGNIRELKNIVERLVVIGEEDLITKDDVVSLLDRKKYSFNLKEYKNSTLKEITNMVEKEMIEKALNQYKSSRKAAKVLGISQPTVLRKAKALGIKKW